MQGIGEIRSFEWGGMTATVFWVDRATQLGVVCLTQLVPGAVVYKLRTELKAIFYSGEGRARL